MRPNNQPSGVLTSVTHVPHPHPQIHPRPCPKCPIRTERAPRRATTDPPAQNKPTNAPFHAPTGIRAENKPTDPTPHPPPASARFPFRLSPLHFTHHTRKWPIGGIARTFGGRPSSARTAAGGRGVAREKCRP
jgi:hypothetical protein